MMADFADFCIYFPMLGQVIDCSMIILASEIYPLLTNNFWMSWESVFTFSSLSTVVLRANLLVVSWISIDTLDSTNPCCNRYFWISALTASSSNLVLTTILTHQVNSSPNLALDINKAIAMTMSTAHIPTRRYALLMIENFGFMLW